MTFKRKAFYIILALVSLYCPCFMFFVYFDNIRTGNNGSSTSWVICALILMVLIAFVVLKTLFTKTEDKEE